VTINFSRRTLSLAVGQSEMKPERFEVSSRAENAGEVSIKAFLIQTVI
jgi:hypothetical protein